MHFLEIRATKHSFSPAFYLQNPRQHAQIMRIFPAYRSMLPFVRLPFSSSRIDKKCDFLTCRKILGLSIISIPLSSQICPMGICHAPTLPPKHLFSDFAFRFRCWICMSEHDFMINQQTCDPKIAASLIIGHFRSRICDWLSQTAPNLRQYRSSNCAFAHIWDLFWSDDKEISGWRMT
jgi:hypothetical protein